MPEWLKIFFYIILILGIIAGFIFGILALYRKLNTSGTCIFVSYSPTQVKSTSGLIQAGYISCSGGGALWKAKNVTVKNKGPGIFYIGPIPGQSTPQEIDPGDTMSLDVSSIEPVVYYDSSSQYTTPTFTLIA